MAPGSLVVVKKLDHLTPDEKAIFQVDWLPIQDEQTIYTIRELCKQVQTGNIYGFLEEGTIGHNRENGKEIGIRSDFLIEVLPPLNFEELLLIEEFA